MESVDNSQFNPPNYFSREDQRPREHQRGYSKVCLRRVCFRCEPLSREISRIFFFPPTGNSTNTATFRQFFTLYDGSTQSSAWMEKEDTYTEERLSSKTIIVASIITIFSLLIWSSERIVEFRLITVLKVIKI